VARFSRDESNENRMPGSLIIALDAMGGDFGPEVVVPGASISAVRHPQISFLMFGDEARIRPLVEKDPKLVGRVEIIHTTQTIAMDAKPSHAIRRGKGSSMWLALEAVREGRAAVAVSAGNTGALMALYRLMLKPLGDIERPAIAAIWPTLRAESLVLDVGANIGATSRQLCDFALMGAGMARALFHLERPTVGLLNVGVEEIKGAEEVKEAHLWLKNAMGLPFEYAGYVEGDDIGQGKVDVVVVEGFAGNIALKTAEGTARQIGTWLREAMTGSALSKFGALLAQGGFRALKRKMDPRRVNGGTFLGHNGLAIKSHGGTDALGFASAIDLGYDMASHGLVERLRADLDAFHGALRNGVTAPPATGGAAGT
jgi:glycerol-3-phosphate acyltransferase PlsX